jgi:alpha-tubulin suppressor-like RCC1 family protein
VGCTRRLRRESFDRRLGQGRDGSAVRLLATLAVVILWLSGGGASAASAASYGPVAWGDNNYGQLGNGEFEGFRIAPVAVGKLGEEVTRGDEVAVGEESTALAAGFEHGLALLRNGKVMAWGENGYGQLGDGTSLGPETCVFFSECSTVPVEVKGLDEATAIAAGYYSSLALLSSGKVMAWGNGGDGQLGDGSEFDSDVPMQVTGLSEATAIAGGGFHGLALLRNGKVMAWGENRSGQLGDGNETNSDVPVAVAGLHEVTAIAAGLHYSLALLKNGTVMAWGENESGQLGDGNETNSNVPVEVKGLHEVAAIASDGNHSLALLKDGGVMAWGDNDAGQLGDGSETNSNVPVEVHGLNGVKAMAAGVEHSLALLHDGKIMAWGNDGAGQLGTGNENREDSDVPVEASELSGVTAIAAGGYSSYAEQGEIGEVSGQVTSAATSSPIEGVKVCAVNVSGPDRWRCATTDAAGEYTVTVRESGSYDVRFSAPPGSGYVASEYYNGKLSSTEETAVPVALGATTSGIDARLVEGGYITGSVISASTKTPVAGVEVCARESGAECVLSNENGQYTISGLATGEYKVEFYSNSGMYIPQYWNGKSLAAEGELVHVTLGQATSRINAELEPLTNGAITGTVRDGTSTQGIKGIEVCAYEMGGEETGGLFGQCAETNGGGEYAILELTTGEYLVEFSSPFNSGLNYVTQYFNASSSAANATLVHVGTKSIATGIDAQLNEGGRVAGKVTDASTTAAIAGIEVCAYSTSGEGFGCASTDSNGEYTISALGSGEYDVEFYSPPNSGLDYVTQYYNGQHKASVANPVSVTEGQTTQNIDARLEEGGRIEGTVTDVSTGAAIKGVLVCALVSISESASCAVTDTRGDYAITGLVGGQYKVGFDGWKNYIIQYYNNKLSFAEGQEVTVSVGDTASGVDAAMSASHSIPPANTKPPAVLGTPAVGETLLCADGLWTGSPTPILSDRWLRDGTPIPSATAGSYTVQNADAGHGLACEVMARSSAGERSAVSARVAIPGSPPPTVTATTIGPVVSSSSSTTSSGATGVKSYTTGLKPSITVTASTLAAADSVRVHVQCWEQRCAGKVELTIRSVRRLHSGGRTLTRATALVLAKGSLHLVGKGKSATIVLRLTTAGSRRLAHADRRNPVVVELSVSAPGVKTIVIRSVRVT